MPNKVIVDVFYDRFLAKAIMQESNRIGSFTALTDEELKNVQYMINAVLITAQVTFKYISFTVTQDVHNYNILYIEPDNFYTMLWLSGFCASDYIFLHEDEVNVRLGTMPVPIIVSPYLCKHILLSPKFKVLLGDGAVYEAIVPIQC